VGTGRLDDKTADIFGIDPAVDGREVNGARVLR
jgi:hypothetical protein